MPTDLALRLWAFKLARLAAALAGLLLAAVNTSALAAGFCPGWLAREDASAPDHRGELTVSPYTHHWSQNPEHKPVVLVAADELLPGDRLCGLSLFSNSFGQPSAYVYVGQQFNHLWNQPQLFAKISLGILYGYVGPYQDKVPLNHNGFSPAIIPALGYQLTPADSVQLHVLGTAAVMFSYGRRF